MLSKKFKFLSLFVTVMLILCFITGCTQSETVTPVAPEGDGLEQPPSTRTVIDQAGREVTIPAKVEKLVTAWRPCTFLVFAIGGQEKLVGVDGGSTATPFTVGVYPGIKDVAQTGDKKSGINLEEVVALDPDVICVWAEMKNEGVIEQLEDQGIATLVIIPESAEDMKEAATLLGEVLGCTEQAEKVIAYYDNTVAMVKDRLKDVPEEERKQVYLAGAHGVLSSCGSDFYQHDLIEKAGGVNVAAELKGGWQNVSPEQLLLWDPDIIIADPYCKETMEDAVKMDPALASVKAVKDDALYNFPTVGQWSFPIPQSAMGILWLSKVMYPEHFADINFEEEVNSYSQEFFGITHTELWGDDIGEHGN